MKPSRRAPDAPSASTGGHTVGAALPGRSAASLALPYAAFFLSGAAGLMYEVCWIRRATLVFGCSTYAVSTVLAVFFLGLAIGSEWFGRISEHTRTPLRLYAALEAGLALLALASLVEFPQAESIYGHIYRGFSDHPALLTLSRALLVSVVLLPPAVLMGATLPLICRQFVRSAGRIAGSVGFLYGLNTLGAAAGCAWAGLWLLPRIGVSGTVALGAAFSLTAGAIAIRLRLEPPVGAAAPGERPVAVLPRAAAVVMPLLFVAGFSALACEVLWTRFLGLVLRNTVFTYTITLTTVLTGIVIGSFVASRWFDRVRARATVFGILQALTGVTVLAVMSLPPAFWRGHADEISVCLILMLPAAILSGASLPLGVRMVVEDPRLAGIGVGRVLAVNTLGGICGSLAAGFLLLPYHGLHAGVRVVTGLSVAAGFAAIAFVAGRPTPMRLALAAAGVVLWLGIPAALPVRLPADFLASVSELVDFREGLVSNVAVLRRGDVLALRIDGWWQGQDLKSHQIMAAHVPMLLHPDARRIAVVGLGVGQTASRFLEYDIERMDVVDLEPALFDIVPRHFDSAWMRDPRVRLLSEDGRSYVTHTRERYDIISIEVGLAFRPGVPAFYTVDFYRRARARLAPGGLLVQFLPLLALPPETIPGVIESFREVFPHSVLWYNTAEGLLIGHNADGFDIDRARLAATLTRGPVRADLADFGYMTGPEYTLDHPDVLLSGFLCGPRGLSALAGNARPYRDDVPALDYSAARGSAQQKDEVALGELLRRHLDPLASIVHPPLPADTTGRIERLRDLNLRLMVSTSLRLRIETSGLSWENKATFRLIERAVQVCPEDASANRLMGEALQRGARSGESRPWLERAIALDPRDGVARLDLGWLLFEQGDAAGALEHLRQAVALRPGDSNAHNGLGAAYAAAGRLDSARVQFQAALGIDPGNTDVQQNLRRAEDELRARDPSMPSPGAPPSR